MDITLQEEKKTSFCDKVSSQQAKNVSEELIASSNSIKQLERGTDATEDHVPFNLLLSITVVSDSNQ